MFQFGIVPPLDQLLWFGFTFDARSAQITALPWSLTKTGSAVVGWKGEVLQCKISNFCPQGVVLTCGDQTGIVGRLPCQN